MSLLDNLKNVLSKKDHADEFIQKKSLAEQGDANAQNDLGIMYATGKGLAKNYSEAWKWYSLAIKQKHPNAADNRLRLAHAMTRAQVAEVDKNMKVWIQNTFEKNRPALETRIGEIVDQHRETLSQKYKQNVHKDDYGDVFFDKWDNEIDYFIEKVVLFDREIDKLLWESENYVFHQMCTNIINNIIGCVAE
jgi:TPR repeat protein